MAQNEGLRKTGEPVVISDTPDVCLTPVGAAKVPVPYDIVAYFTDSIQTAPTVFFTKDPVFTTFSAIPKVIGDEAGVDKGVVSGTHAGGGFCHVVPMSHTPVVFATNYEIVFHTSKMWMNCPSPTAPGNTIGTVQWLDTARTVSTDANGKVAGDTDPKEQAETKEELDKKLAQQNGGQTQKPEEKWKTKVEPQESAGYDSTKDMTLSDQNKSYGTPHDKTPNGVDTSRAIDIKSEQNVLNESLYDTGGKDNFFRVGNVDVNRNVGYSYDATKGVHSYGVGGDAGVYGLRGQLKGEIPGGLVGGTLKGEALSAKANASAGVFHGGGNVGAKAGAGIEGNLVKVQGGVETTLTIKRAYDSTVGALLGRFDKTKAYATAPNALDIGVVIGAEVEVGIGAGAAASAEGQIGKDGAKGSARLAVGAGPKAAVKLTGGVKLPDGLVDGAIDMGKGALKWLGW